MADLLLSPELLPELTPDTREFFRAAYGALLLAHLVFTLPSARRFFTSERWGGYARSSAAVDAVQNPRVLPLVLALWVACAVLLIAGVWTVFAALVNVVICHYFFVWMRWRGVLRGMGAPGFMTYWLALAVLLLEASAAYAPSVSDLALLAVQVDFAVLFLSAGVYKLFAGYRKNYGVDLGLANPEWGYWWRMWARVRPGDWKLKALNQLGWASEIAAAVLMLVPPTRFLGAVLLVLTFLLVRTQVRLGVLSEMVMLVGVVFFFPESAGDRAVRAVFSWIPASSNPWSGGDALATPLAIALVAYLALLPFAHAGLYVNLFGRRRLPPPLQRALERYTNAFGIIVWRVFSVDVVNFFVRIYRERSDAPRELVSTWGRGRYGHVAEAITVTSLFTTLKYFPSNDALFVERLLRYARTVPRGDDETLAFEYVAVEKAAERFEHVSAAEFAVDVEAGTVVERTLRDDLRPRGGHETSPVHEAARPGTYAPLTS